MTGSSTGSAAPRAVAVIGPSGSGKTSLLAALVPVLGRRGLRIATLKHDAHEFEFDHPGKDSHRLFEAGAVASGVASRSRFAFQRRLDAEAKPEELIRRHFDAAEVDVVLVEGWRECSLPKIEVWRDGVGDVPLRAPSDASVVAFVSTSARRPEGVRCPVYAPEDVSGVADFIERAVLGRGRSPRRDVS